VLTPERAQSAQIWLSFPVQRCPVLPSTQPELHHRLSAGDI
jgi:hypothetical protein